MHEALNDKASYLLETGQSGEAIQILEPLVTGDAPLKEDFCANVNYCVALGRLGLYEQAVNHMNPLVNGGFLSHNSTANLNFANDLANLGCFEVALAHIEAKSKEGECLCGLPAGSIYYVAIACNAKQPERAIQYIEKDVTVGFLKKDVGAQTLYLSALIQAGKLEKGVAHANRILGDDELRKASSLHCLRATMLVGLGRPDEAVKKLEAEMVGNGALVGNKEALVAYRQAVFALAVLEVDKQPGFGNRRSGYSPDF
ncbi:MAG: tetratricopeptide repeat protein [Alphaproteobacteria bacterium]|nr:tetratricopeptide repeat protein [Alphaproteobacteria bacterium]